MKTRIPKHLLAAACGALIALPATGVAQSTNPPSPPVIKTAVLQCQSRVQNNSSATKSDPQTQTYTAPTGFVILSYNVVDRGHSGKETETWTHTQVGNLVSDADFTSAYQKAFATALSENLPGSQKNGLLATLANSYNTNLAYKSALATTYKSIQLQTNAWGQGSFKEGSSASLSLDVMLLQVGPSTPGSDRSFIITWCDLAWGDGGNPSHVVAWQNYLAISTAGSTVGLGYLDAFSLKGTHILTMQQIVSSTCATVGWPAIDLSAVAKKAAAWNSSTVPSGNKVIQEFVPVKLIPKQVVTKLNTVSAKAGVGRG
jgi:hypothetical protein